MAQSQDNRDLSCPKGGKVIVEGTAFNACRAVNCAVAGSSTVTWIDGSSTTYYFVQGLNPMQITNIAAGGGASGFVAVY